MLLGAELQITNMFGNTFLHSFDKDPMFASSFIVQHASIIMSISQISETLFILTIPFFLSRYGIKNVMMAIRLFLNSANASRPSRVVQL